MHAWGGADKPRFQKNPENPHKGKNNPIDKKIQKTAKKSKKNAKKFQKSRKNGEVQTDSHLVSKYQYGVIYGSSRVRHNINSSFWLFWNKHHIEGKYQSFFEETYK